MIRSVRFGRTYLQSKNQIYLIGEKMRQIPVLKTYDISNDYFFDYDENNNLYELRESGLYLNSNLSDIYTLRPQTVGLKFTNGNVNGGFYPLGIKVKAGNQPFGVIAETNIETTTGTPNETINPVPMNLWADLTHATSINAGLWQLIICRTKKTPIKEFF